jgi:hypothetical protein
MREMRRAGAARHGKLAAAVAPLQRGSFFHSRRDHGHFRR